VPMLGAGAACTDDAACPLNQCLGGFCCAATCATDAGSCGASACAKGSGGCVYPTAQCSPGSCAGGPGPPPTQTNAANCSNGSCPAATQTPCSPYNCGQTSCLTSCKHDSDCSPGNHCMAGTCVGPGGP
jgi:hypothetical protein